MLFFPYWEEIEMTTLATITYKNQLTIPKKIIEALGLGKIRRVLISVRGKQIAIKPLESKVDELAGSLSYLSSTKKPADLKKIRKKTQELVAAEIAKEGI